MLIELSLQIVIPLLVLITFWILPSLMPADLAFGVRIPPNHQEDALISRVRRDFRLTMALVAIVFLIGSISLVQAFPSPWISPGTVLVVLIVSLLNYLIAHYRLRIVKRRENWFAGQRQTIAADTELYQEPVHLPIAWLVLTIALVVALFVIAALRYPSLPDRIATHFDANGVPNGWMDKGIGAFLIPLIALVLTIMFILMAYFLPRTRTKLDPANIEASRIRYHKLQRFWSVTLLLISVLTNILMLVVSLLVLQLLPDTTNTVIIGIAVTIFPILIIAIILVMYYRQLGGQQMKQNETEPPYVTRDDDRYWKAGTIYFNRNDPSFFVPKRFGLGWTLNFAHPGATVFMVVLLAIIVAALILPFVLR